MTTKTMERQVHSEPPEPINPARGRLAAKLDEFERALANLDDYRSFQITTPGNNEALVQTVKNVLSKFGIAVAAAGETI